MEYFLEFHWWYVPVAIVLLFFIFGKGKGGVVTTRYSVEFDILDARFESCKPEADYSIFKEGQPHHIDIEIERLPHQDAAQFEIWLNDIKLAEPSIKRNRKIEFDHWSDEEIEFPVINEGDRLEIRCNTIPVLKGIFQVN